MGNRHERRRLDLVFDAQAHRTNEGVVLVRLMNRNNTVVKGKFHFTDEGLNSNTVSLYGAIIALHVLLTYCRDFVAPKAIRICSGNYRFIKIISSSMNGNEQLAKLKSEIQSLLLEIRNKGVEEFCYCVSPTGSSQSDRVISAVI